MSKGGLLGGVPMLWNVTLFGGLQAEDGRRSLMRFATHKTAALLAFLAYHRERVHSREVLTTLLWPDCPPEVGRHRLRQALSSLRHQLEPPPTSRGSVLRTGRVMVGLNPEAVSTDVAEFESLLDAAAVARTRAKRTALLMRAVELYRGEFLPGFYEEWIFPEQLRLAERFHEALRQLLTDLERAGDLDRALRYALRGVSADPLREDTHLHLIRLYLAAGQPLAALRQCEELERVLAKELKVTPSAAASALRRDVEARLAARSGKRGARTGARGSVPLADARGSVPVGVVTFLASDAPAGDDRVTWSRAIRRSGGIVVEADEASAVAAFARSSDAIGCAIECQRALRARLRMGLDTGEVELREGKYHGSVLPHAMRLLEAGHAGQVLCAEGTAAVMQRDLNHGARFVNLGLYRLPEETRAEPVFQLDHAAMPQREFPPLRAEAEHAATLPVYLTSFFGREEELQRLYVLLTDPHTRLVTLTGPGGSGKSRLAAEVIEQLARPLRSAVWFVPLADVTDPALVPEAILAALRLLRQNEVAPLEQVVETLRRQPALLVLDNMEHLMGKLGNEEIEEIGETTFPNFPISQFPHIVIQTLLARVPTLKLLVTSRQRVNLSGEREFFVPPLPLPEPPHPRTREHPNTRTPEHLMTFPSVQLFVDRARAAHPDFRLTAANAAAVAELCARLEGIPLALELAAARAAVLTPALMLKRLRRRFELLTSPIPDAPPRHRSLRAALDWSYQLLPLEAQRFFARLSVFRGGWTLEAAEAVCADAGHSTEPLVLDYVAQLRDASLLVTHGAEEIRFRLLETLREFAAEQLPPDESDRLSRRHLTYFTALAETEVKGSEESLYLNRLGAEQENLRAALEWGLRTEPEAALRLSSALGWFWMIRGQYREGYQSLGQALDAAPDAPASLRARALAWMGVLICHEGDHAAGKVPLDQSLEMSRALGDEAHVAFVLFHLALWQNDDATRLSMLTEGLALARATGKQSVAADCLRAMGWIAGRWGALEQARACHEQALQIERERGSQHGCVTQLANLAHLTSASGNLEEARTRFEEALAGFRELGDQCSAAGMLGALARIAEAKQDWETALSLYREDLEIRLRIGYKLINVVWTLTELGWLHARTGDAARAVRLLAAASALDAPATEPPPEPPPTAEGFAALRQTLGDAAFTAAWEAGRAMTREEALAYALAE